MHSIFPGPFLWGMHVLWWLFWIVVIASFLTWLVPVRRKNVPKTPLEILERRYAEGDIGRQEYEERRSLPERDAPLLKR